MYKLIFCDKNKSLKKMRILILILIFSLPTIIFANSLDTKLKKLWGTNLANTVIKECQQAKISVSHCKITVTFIGGNESSYGKRTNKNNLFGNGFTFKTKEDSIKDFVHNRYNKYYYLPEKYKPIHFYSNSPKIIPKTNYCRSEYQPNGKLLNYCPNGYLNSMFIYNSLLPYSDLKK